MAKKVTDQTTAAPTDANTIGNKQSTDGAVATSSGTSQVTPPDPSDEIEIEIDTDATDNNSNTTTTKSPSTTEPTQVAAGQPPVQEPTAAQAPQPQAPAQVDPVQQQTQSPQAPVSEPQVQTTQQPAATATPVPPAAPPVQQTAAAQTPQPQVQQQPQSQVRYEQGPPLQQTQVQQNTGQNIRQALESNPAPAVTPQQAPNQSTQAPAQPTRGGGGGGRGVGCNPIGIILFPFRLVKKIACLGCLIPILIVAAIFALIYFQPPVLWNPVKGVINSGITSEGAVNLGERTEAELPTAKLLAEPQDLIVGERPDQVRISETELAAMLREQFPNAENTFLDIDADKIRLLVNIDDEGDPLWFFFDLNIEDGQRFIVSGSGTGISQLPASVLSGVNSTATLSAGVFNLENPNQIFTSLLQSERELVNITSMQLTDEALLINTTDNSTE